MEDTADVGPKIDDDDTPYILLYFACAEEPGIRQLLPTPSRLIFEPYLQKQELVFKDDDEMEEFMKMKHREMLHLNRQQKKLPEIEKRYLELLSVVREQNRLLSFLYPFC